MSDWIKAFNPMATIGTEAEALKAARASAIAIFIGVAFSLLGVVMMMNGGLEAMESAVAAQSAGGDPQIASMTGAIAQFTLYLMIVVVVVQLILGFVQWAKPNMVIPILFIVLVVYGLGSTVLAQMMAGQIDVPETPMNAPWMIVLGIVVMVVELILHIAGVRGAGALKKFRDARAY
ncbi:hypothetical protein [Brevundimonas sp.]|uniref:hypothetical protein n=1 Tax=Brevundimonas sp. TaxID=1871086 RepID=UPI002D6D4711|nr:hypothetical protein [Brevundimonas sp.]HYC98878.1 hypothetical protein [Brevundimonas sp.]